MSAKPVPPIRKPSAPPKQPAPARKAGVTQGKKIALAAGFLLLLVGVGFWTYLYVRFSRLIDSRLSGDVFSNASQVFAAPTPIQVGEPATPEEVAARLRRALYAETQGGSRVGTYRLAQGRLEIVPGAASFFRTGGSPEGPAAITFRGGHIVSIASLGTGAPLDRYLLEPEVITTMFDNTRSKRRVVRYQDLPQVLVNSVIAAEDHQFFFHHGVNFYRILAAAVADLRAEERVQGGSTLTMQLARSFFLTPRRALRRKMEEIFLALIMEQRLTKEQIFELYSNQIYLGQRGSFSIYGFGEAANAYFNKDLASLTLPEAALLAGLIRGPNLYSPFKYPARALERRNHVLREMLDLDQISSAEAEKALAAPLDLAAQNVEGLQAPYFVDMLRDQLLAQFSERDLLSQSYRIYSTLDMDLQRAASEGVRAGLVDVDKEVSKRKRAKDEPPMDPNQPQVALIALDAHTGEIKALVGGRNYGISQLNHVLAKRPPGSSFKPFVYAAALSSGVDGSQPLVTTATIVNDEPATFQFADQVYEPENYKQEYHGLVTLRTALTFSLNVATVRLAEMIGYDKVRNLAIAAGINKDLLATPAIALGAYVATPLEIAGAYSIFSNSGEYVEPRDLLAVNDSSGRTLWRSPSATRQVLDPRVAYLMDSLLESVINNGTGAGVRSRGFTLPAAGKTGTSHDGWFAGFTSDLLAVVWVGYDDDRDLKLPGASSALPIWTEFMKRAVEIPAYQDAEPFEPPPGVVSAPVVENTGADGSVAAREEYFIAGTEPRPSGPGNVVTGVLSRLFHTGSGQTLPPAATATGPVANHPDPATLAAQPPAPVKKKRGIMNKFISMFKRKGPKPAAPDDSQNRPQPQE